MHSQLEEITKTSRVVYTKLTFDFRTYKGVCALMLLKEGISWKSVIILYHILTAFGKRLFLYLKFRNLFRESYFD